MNIDANTDIQFGYCQCGCGERSSIAQRSNRNKGYTAGQPFKYVQGHSSRRILAKRFWSKLNTIDKDACWEWQGWRKHEYGQCFYKGRYRLAHRVAWELINGAIPDGLCVLHKCDNPPCCNPSHHFLGTRADNVIDMAKKGRQVTPPRPGELHPMARLTETDVREIRQLVASGLTRIVVARSYRVSDQHVSDIVLKKSWSHIA